MSRKIADNDNEMREWFTNLSTGSPKTRQAEYKQGDDKTGQNKDKQEGKTKTRQHKPTQDKKKTKQDARQDKATQDKTR